MSWNHHAHASATLSQTDITECTPRVSPHTTVNLMPTHEGRLRLRTVLKEDAAEPAHEEAKFSTYRISSISIRKDNAIKYECIVAELADCSGRDRQPMRFQKPAERKPLAPKPRIECYARVGRSLQRFLGIYLSTKLWVDEKSISQSEKEAGRHYLTAGLCLSRCKKHVRRWLADINASFSSPLFTFPNACYATL
jgi:hypothetical protein